MWDDGNKKAFVDTDSEGKRKRILIRKRRHGVQLVGKVVKKKELVVGVESDNVDSPAVLYHVHVGEFDVLICVVGESRIVVQRVDDVHQFVIPD